jgi:hypothetical protein
VEHICPKCNILMVEAVLFPERVHRIYKKSVKKGILGVKTDDITNINQCVCPNCGYIEYYAEDPEKFK